MLFKRRKTIVLKYRNSLCESYHRISSAKVSIHNTLPRQRKDWGEYEKRKRIKRVKSFLSRTRPVDGYESDLLEERTRTKREREREKLYKVTRRMRVSEHKD